MAAQIGRNMLIKIGDGQPTEAFTTVAGLRSKTLTVNSETVEITNSDSANKMRELLAGAGIVNFAVSGSGVFTDAVVHATLNTKALAGGIDNYQVIVPGLGTYEGAFQITSLELGAAEHNAEIPFSISLESAGDITFAAE